MNRMKPFFFTIALCLLWFVASAQIPNSNFEEWEVVDSIENLMYWQTNNFYVGYFPIIKIDNAIEGNYSMKVSTQAKDLYGNGSWPGCARIKFVPTAYYQYMTASVQIDSIKMGATEIRLKQKGADGFYHKIGGWKRTTFTNGATTIWFPVEYIHLDTMSLEIWTFNRDQVFGGSNDGYSEITIDNLSFTNILSTDEPQAEPKLHIYPNPSNGLVTIQLSSPFSTETVLHLYDLQGRERKSYNFPYSSELQLDVSDLAAGVYMIELSNGEETRMAREKLIILD